MLSAFALPHRYQLEGKLFCYEEVPFGAIVELLCYPSSQPTSI
jgi:hypothetical protein